MKSGNKTWLSQMWSRWGRGQKVAQQRQTSRRRAFFLESLEERRVMAADLGTLSSQTVLGGSPLFLPLNGTSTVTGAPLTYTVTSSNPSLVDAFVLTGNRSAKISVANFGDMTFELFDNYVPDVTGRFVTLATGNAPELNGPFFNHTATNTVTFHRVINNFVIQAGDPTGTGAGGSPLPDFDDEFNLNLQHNRTGLLSMAKTLDDTNDSQFFITEGAQRHLDFQHSIFGILTSGESVRDAISNVPTNSNGKPASDVVISSVSIFNDLQNRVLGLKAANGASGEADVTVTVSDGTGQNVTRTFHVNVTPDTVNNNPFLQPITTPKIAAGGPGTFQIAAVDAENDAIYYDATKVGSVNYTLSVNNSTGLVTVTPPAGFVGTLQVQIGVKNPNTAVVPGVGESQAQAQSRVFDLQTIDVVVAPQGPTGVDLLAMSDSGSSSTDNVTNATTMRFDVSGVANGDVVRLFADGTLVGTANATGSTVTIETNSIAALGSGAHQITATRVAGGIESLPSTPFTLTFDQTAPAAFTTQPPTSATATQLISYDVQNPEEGSAGFTYSLTGQPQGATINPTTGLLTWTPTAAQVGTFQFSIVASDAAGNATNQAVTLNVAQFVQPLIDVQLSIVDTNGNTLTQIPSNGTFFLVVKAKELGDDPRKIISLYNDITFDSSMVQKTGDVIYANRFSEDNALAVPNAGGFGSAGLFNELGSIDAAQLLSNNGPASFDGYEEIYRVPMKALRGGTLTISADPADDSSNITFAYGKNQGNDPVAGNEIAFHSASAQIATSFTPVADTFTNIVKGSSNNELDVLANDPAGANGPLTIVAVGTPNQGGVVTISNGKLRYTPAPNFDQTETFTYTVQNSLGEQAVANVSVSIQAAPGTVLATNDSFTAVQGQAIVLNVLGNDTGGTTGSPLTITSVSNSSNATITRVDGNTKISYTPNANFSGTDTFTYTITNGTVTSTGTVSVVVSAIPRVPPHANNDSATSYLNSSGTLINVLANDTKDPAASLSISSLGTAAHGSVAVDAATGKVKYVPTSGYTGADSFTYVISDGQTTSQATVSINVAPYQSTSVSGRIFLDGNGNKIQDVGEGPLAGVTVTLQGTDLTGAVVSKSAISNAIGDYTIVDVAPGTYTLTEGVVPLTAPGSAIAGSLGGNAQGNNQINFSISPDQANAGITATNYVFTEIPQQPNLNVSTGKSSLLAKRVTSALAVAVTPGGSAAWLAPSGTGWGNFQSLQASLSSDGNTLHVNATDALGGTQQFQLPTSAAQLRMLSEQNGVQVLQLRGDPAQFGIAAGTASSGNSTGSTSGGLANHAPVNLVPASLSVASGGTLTFSGANALSVSDSDAGTQPLKVTLSATNGKLSLSTLAGLTFSSGSGTAASSMTFTGTVSAINAALNGATFIPNTGFTGAATVQITTNDQGNTGTGGALIDIDSMAVAVTAAGSGEGEGGSFASAADEFFNLLA